VFFKKVLDLLIAFDLVLYYVITVQQVRARAYCSRKIIGILDEMSPGPLVLSLGPSMMYHLSPTASAENFPGGSNGKTY